jgi:hypothetical protein
VGRPTDRASESAYPLADQDLELTLGPDLAGRMVSPQTVTVFASDTARRAVWLRRREQLIEAAVAHEPAHRPWAFWEYDDRHRVDELERIRALVARGELRDSERDELAARGREAAERIRRGVEQGCGLDHRAAAMGELVAGGASRG